VKNGPLSARLRAWSPTRVGWKHPTVGVRVGYRPGVSWNLGVSYSRGGYLMPDAAATLPAGRLVGDYRQTTVGPDVSYAWHHWQVSPVLRSFFAVLRSLFSRSYG
jgi:hypothetical protein